MPCYSPLRAYYSDKVNATGKRSVHFNSNKPSFGPAFEVPCGQCIGCRLEKSRQWAVRISLESKLYEENCFITLTYAPEYLPPGGSLDVRAYQLFMKRLRKHYGKKGKTIRFFHCGEYGEQLGRPHYHACLLGFDFPDKYHYRTTQRGERVYRSPTLESLWPFGHCEIGTVTFDSAAYVARYITKKITGPAAQAHYNGRRPEYTTMSRRPGIGAPWLERFQTDTYPHDYVVLNGKKIPPPRFFNSRYELAEPDNYEKIKRKRAHKSNARVTYKFLESSPERLRVKEVVRERTINATLGRKYENNEE